MLGASYLGADAMALQTAYDDAAFRMWLRATDQSVDFIAYVYYHGDSAVYPSYVSRLLTLSSYPLAGSRGRIASLPNFTRSISDSLLGGEIQRQFGELVIDNADGSVDDWANLSIDGQMVRIFYGNRDWGVSRFRLFMECVCDGVEKADDTTITLRLRPLDFRADKPIQTRLIASNTAANAPSNTPVPIVMGKVFNVAPPCIDEPNQIYQMHDAIGWGSLTSIDDVRDSGIPFQSDPVAISAVNAATDVLSTATAHGFYQNTRVRCDIGSMPSATNWLSLAWNGVLFCAVANGTAIAATSIDGTVWRSVTLPVTGNWRKIAWNGQLFVVVADGSTNVALTSPDGTTWTARTMPASLDWNSIAWNGSVFVALASGNQCATSPDAVTWTLRSMPSSQTWTDVVWSGTVFCAVSLGTAAATSADGITWTARTLPSSQSWYNLAWNGTIFCAIGNTSDKAATSPDGITWTQRTLPSSDQWWGVAWNGTVFVVVTRGVSTVAATSPDGVTWTARTMPIAADWLAVAWNGYVFCAIGNGTNYVASSADGATWTLTNYTLPSPLVNSTDYYVILLTSTTFKLAATRGGAAIDITTTTTGAPLVGYNWTPEVSTGKVYLDHKPLGQLTVDCVGQYTLASTAVPAALGISANIDALSQANFATTCPQTIGVYVGERRNRREVAADIVSGLGAWYGYNRTNLLRFGRLEASNASYDWTVTDDDMFTPLVIERIVQPRKQHRLGYRRNWTDQSQGLASGVSSEARGLYSTPHSVTPVSLGADESTDGTTGFHLLAEKPDVIETMMAYGSDAATEASRRNTLFYGNGAIFSTTIGRIGWVMEPGDKVKVVYPRWNLTSGVTMTLVHVEDQPNQRRCVIKLFAALSAYVPGAL